MQQHWHVSSGKRTSCWETGLWFSCVLILTCMCVQSLWQRSRNAIWLQVKTFKPNCSIKQLESMLWSESNSHFAFQTPHAPHVLFLGLNVAEKDIVLVLKWRVADLFGQQGKKSVWKIQLLIWQLLIWCPIQDFVPKENTFKIQL